MPNQHSKVIPISHKSAHTEEVDAIAELAYQVWLAGCFRSKTPEEALFWAEREIKRRRSPLQDLSAGLFLIRKKDA